jgi:IclR family transcriptional regulator, acetate operon repressor
MMTGDKPTRRVKTTDTVFEIIEMIHELDGASLVELSRELEFAKSTIHDHLATLESKEYVIRSGNEYSLSLRFLYHGMFVKNRLDISHVGQPVIEELAEQTGEVAWIIVEEHGRAIYLNKAMGEKAVQTHAIVGGRGYLHHLASGKAILAYLPDERVDEIIARHGLPELTPHTVTDRDELEAEFERIKEEGIALNDKETVRGLRAAAAPVRKDDLIVGAITVSGPASRMTKNRCYEEIKPLLLEAVNEIELKLQYPHS